MNYGLYILMSALNESYYSEVGNNCCLNLYFQITQYNKKNL